MFFPLETLLMLIQAPFTILESIVITFLPMFLRKKKDIHGQTVLITGAGSGLGHLMAIRFANKGCRLVLWDINEEGNKRTALLAEMSGVKAYPYKVDLGKPDDVYETAERVLEEVGDIDILVNNAGVIMNGGQSILDSQDYMIQKTIDINATAHIWTVKCFLPAMIEKNRGHLVTIASAAGLFGVNGLVDYCSSKFAAVGLHEALTLEWAKNGNDGISGTLVCPYYINTGMFDGVKTKFPNLLPVLDPLYVVDKTVDAILTNQSVVIIPRLMYLCYMLKGLLPTKTGRLVMKYFGICDNLEDYRPKGKVFKEE